MSASARGIVPSLIKIVTFAVVTMLFTAALGTTIVNVNFGPHSGYTAVFTSASGLGSGDGVRIAGVKVGEVSTVKTTEVDGKVRAEVRFNVESGRRIPAKATAAVKYKNLIGQRYLALGTDVPRTGERLASGARIPMQRTEPALNLTNLFNGFKPLFEALDPKQVNQLSYEIIRVFQGQGGTVRSLLAHTASLTSTIAQKDKVIGEVIDNLNHVLDTVNNHGPELGDLIDITQQLVSGLAAKREPLGNAVSALGELTTTTAGLLDRVREPLHDDIAHLDRVSKNLLDKDKLIDHLLQVTPQNLADFTNTLSYGSWYNYYACSVTLQLGVGDASFDLPFLPLPGSHRPERCGP